MDITILLSDAYESDGLEAANGNSLLIVPGSSYWNVAFAGRSKGDVFKDEEGISTIKNFGQKVAWLLKKINA